MPDYIYIIFLFALGACVGSFLNVVVWRVPRIEHPENEGILRGFFTTVQGLSEPPSHCPKCEKLLKWYDNIPVLGWIHLGGKCRFCKAPISPRYPIIEAITGLMFVGYCAAFFILQIGPCGEITSAGIVHHQPLILMYHWWIYGLDMALLSALLAASLIDAELFQIPIEIPWTIVPVAILVHAIYDRHGGPGSVAVGPLPTALAVGGAVGVVLSIVLLNFGVLPQSFAEGTPLLEVEKKQREEQRLEDEKSANKKWEKGEKRADDELAERKDMLPEEREFSPAEIRREIGKEMLFLLPPLALGLACMILVMRVPAVAHWWDMIVRENWVAGLLGSVLGGLVGGFTVWITRILGSFGFGKQAMGMGDVDLMVAVGAVLGANAAVVVFFAAPFFGIATSIYLLITRKGRELPYGPYLSMATAFVILFYCPIAAYFAPGLSNAASLIGRIFGGG